MSNKVYKIIGLIAVIFVILIPFFLIYEIYVHQSRTDDQITFEVDQGDTAYKLAEKLKNQKIINSTFIFKLLLVLDGRDKNLHAGLFFVNYPITMIRVARALAQPGMFDQTITIIPGWNLRQVANYLVKEGLATSTDSVLEFANNPLSHWPGGLANDFEARPDKASLEGYLAPNTYRVYKDASLNDVFVKLAVARNDELNQYNLYPEKLQKSGMTVHQILTLASIIEKEANTPEDMAIVADIFLRRLNEGMALQSCATVNYITGKNDPGVSSKDKQIDSPYNTYKYPGLPPGPICNPSLDAIKAVLNPTKNNYVYFMAGDDGVMRYARTLDEHNQNVAKYLK